jgi:adenylate kinase family enzyme
MSKQAMREEAERLIRETMEKKALVVKQGNTRIEAVCGKCGGQLVQRADDNEEVVRERLKVYERATKPLVEFYRERPTFRVVNGAQPHERVAHELDTVIDDAALASGRVEKAVTGKAVTPEKAART